MINGSLAMDPARDVSIARQNLHGSLIDSPTQMGLRGNLFASAPSPNNGASSQPDPVPIERGQFGTLIGLTTGTSPAPVPGGKSYKRGLR